jgi:hypothetical protein
MEGQRTWYSAPCCYSLLLCGLALHSAELYLTGTPAGTGSAAEVLLLLLLHDPPSAWQSAGCSIAACASVAWLGSPTSAISAA